MDGSERPAGERGKRPLEKALRQGRRRAKKALRRASMALGLYTIPYLYVAYMWFVYKTSRVETIGPHPAHMQDTMGRAIFALWHDEVFFVAYAFGSYRPDTLASKGDAGAIITRMLQLCGFHVFRGGSTTGRRREDNTELVQNMIDHMREGDRIVYGITTDGSKGPVYRMKIGAVTLAIGADAPICVERTWCKRYFRLGTWDRTVIPLPFNHIVHFFAGPILPPRPSEGPEAAAKMRDEVEHLLCRATAYAWRHIEGEPPPDEWIERFPEPYREEMKRAERPPVFLPVPGSDAPPTSR